MVMVKYVDGRAVCRTKMVGGDLGNHRLEVANESGLRKDAATEVSVGRARGRSEWKRKLASQAERKKSTKK